MENFFFCARNAEDYFKGLPVIVLNNDKFLDEPEVQRLFKNMNGHNGEYSDKFLDAPITLPTRADIPDLKLDFNWGLRLEVPAGIFHVRIIDVDSGLIFLDRDISERRIISVEKYFIRWRIEIYLDGRKIFAHTFNLRDKKVLINIPKNAGMGDIISMLPYIEDFRRRNGCQIFIKMPEYLREFTKHVYPNFLHVDDIAGDYYATFQLSMPMNSLGVPIWQTDFRNYPMGRLVGVALGSNKIAQKKTFQPAMPPVTNEPYVCIAVQASSPKKGWLYPGGWNIVVNYLKSLGLRVFCIDRDRAVSTKEEDIIIFMPDGAEDFTGNRPIMERANMLYHAEFFIGLGSGLAWLADAVDCPTVLIGGFSQDWAEFYTPYRVINRLVCHGCFNDMRVNFIKQKCPYHEGTPREFECQKNISPKQVISAINKLLDIRG